jgi:L-ascorbate metabolism protein UlaG (beta-lactamase superfamily)
MVVSKYIHSCLVVEENGKTILIDPGNFTYDEKVLDVDAIGKLDYLLITHEHPDHFYIPLIKEIVGRFSEVKIISNGSVAGLLEKEGIKATTEGDEVVHLQNLPHARLLDIPAPVNTVFTIFGKLTHPGDCINFEKTADVLAMPIQAPWGSMVECCERAVALRPKKIIPIHDYHWRDEIREGTYKRLEVYFRNAGIEFVNPGEPGIKIEL